MGDVSIGKAWEETSSFLGRESKLVIPVALATLTVPAAIQGWVNPALPGQSGAFPLLGLVALLVTVAGQMAIARLAIGWSGSVGEAIGLAFRRLPTLIASALIVYLPMVLVLVVVLGTSVGSEDLARLETMTPEEMVKLPGVIWSVLLFALAVLVLAARFLPSLGIAASEAGGPVRLIKRSWAMTRGNFWRLLGLILLLGIASLIFSSAVQAVAGAVIALVVGPVQPLGLSALLLGLANGLVGAVVGSVYATMVGRIYAQLAVETSVPDHHAR